MLSAFLTKRSQRSNTRQFIGQTIITVSLWLAIALTLVFVTHDLSTGTHIRTRVYIGFGCIVYILGVRHTFKANKEVLANYLLILLFSAITLATLFWWGLNTSTGMLALGLVIALSGQILLTAESQFIAHIGTKDAPFINATLYPLKNAALKGKQHLMTTKTMIENLSQE